MRIAGRFLSTQDKHGKRTGVARGAPPAVDEAKDTKVRTPGEAPRPYLYISSRQEYVRSLQVVVRGQGSAEQLLGEARRGACARPQLVLFQAQTMKQHLGLMLFPPRMAALLLSMFGGLSLLLAVVGLYGLVSYALARRMREIGIRMALGANARDIFGMMLSGGMKLVGTDALTGLLLAAGATWPLSRSFTASDRWMY